MASFKEEFDRIVGELRAHPQVVVFGAELGKPESAASVSASIRSVGIEPTDAMLAFYTQHNGAYLEWGFEGKEYELLGGLNGYIDYGTPPGVINILSASDAFCESWQDDYIINPIVGEAWTLAYGTEEPAEETTSAVVIDSFSNYYHSDLLLGPEPLLVVASDHGADLSCSDYLTFTQYLELVIAQYGSSPYNAVGIGWSREAERVKSIAKPTLDEIIKKAIEDADE